jgi:hypothetical protein
LRGGPAFAEGCGFGAGGFGAAPFPPPPSLSSLGSLSDGSAFGADRELRFSGAAGRGIRRRVIRPCPTVQRFVVTQ